MLNLKNITFISLFCLLSILSFGQNTKNIPADINSANFKSTGLQINNNENGLLQSHSVFLTQNNISKEELSLSAEENIAFLKNGAKSTTIYSQDFESVNLGQIPVNGSTQDGWLVNGSVTSYGSYSHRWGVHSAGYAISGKSLGLSFYNSTSLFNVFGYQYTDCGINSDVDLAVFRVVPTTGYNNIEVSFDWKCSGEYYSGSWVDYGQVGYSTTGGAPFTWITTGGTASGLYHSNTTTQSATVSFPSGVDNNGSFTIAFRAKIDKCGGNQPAFIIDNIVLTGDVPSGPPSCVSIIAPTNGATGTAHSGNLEWSASSGATGYDVYFGTASTPPLVSSNQAGTTYDIGTCLTPETTYYWKVIAKNADGDASGCDTWSFTTDNKLHIYKNDWETANEEYFGTSGGTVDGWNTNDATASGLYNNRWAIGSGANAINGKSAGLTALYNGSLSGSFFEYWWDMGELHRMIYRPFDMTEYRDIELNFDWKCGGESGQEYGEILTSVNGGTNWLTDDQGGLYSDGKYWNSASTIRSQTLTLPETRNNQNNFVLGFNFDDLSGNGSGTDPSFVVDNIVIKACPYEGTLSSPDETEPFAWSPPTANTETTITVDETHNCAYFEWEQSTDNGANWSVISGANNVSYTTPSNLTSNTFYRCRVYFSTGCPGAYQDEAFKIVFSPDCTTPIAPTDGSSIQSTSFRLSWNTDPLATSYDVYFGEDNPPATMIGNTANQFYDVDNMDYNTTYYWQILPTNAGGSASGCDVWSFTTGAEPPQFHNYGGTEQLTFNNSAYKVDNPNFRISHSTNTMEEVQIQISQDVTFSGTTVFDENFIGSFTGENNFETSLEGEVLNESYFPQAFNTNVLTHGYSAGNNTWFAPESHTPIAWTGSGGNPGGCVGYSGTWNNYWGNFLRTPAVDASGMDEITLSFDVWHSYFATHLNDNITFSEWADEEYVNNIVSVKIDGIDVMSGNGFKFSEARETAHVEVKFNISEIVDKSNILFYINASCGYNNSDLFYVYFDNISITGAAEQLVPGTTYYARAKGKVGGNWTDWTTDTHSFTYKNQDDTEWYQTAEPQFLTNTLSDVITASSPDLVTIPEASGTPTNPFSDPSFETNSGWSNFATGGSQLVVNTWDGNNWQSDGSRAARIYMYGGYAMSSDIGIISQTVDLTGVEQIIFDVESHYGSNMGSNLSNGGTLKLIIGGTSSNTVGTTYSTVAHCATTSSGSCTTETLDITVNIDPADRIPNQLVKFVWTGFSSGDLGGALVSFMVDNIRPGVNAVEVGTITSSPIYLSSFYGDNNWLELSWNQTLNGGSLSMSIEEDNAGSWDPVAGFTDLSVTGDGIKTVDISSLSSISRIRVIAEFSETGAKGTQPELNNWIVKTKKDEILPVSLLYFNVNCKENIKILNWSTASETNNDYFVIQRSNDAKNFTDIAQVAGAGNSNQVNNYSFYDEQSSVNEVYYRLKQIDFDGTSETFEIIHADCNNITNSEITAYPNPFDGKILYLNSTSNLKNAVINIYDALGRLVYQTNRKEINSHKKIKIDTQLEPGAYYLKINSKNDINKQIPLIVK